MNPVIASGILGPSSAEVANGEDHNRSPITLSGTGTVEADSQKLVIGKLYTLVVGAVPVRLTLQNNTGISNAVATTDLRLPQESVFTWMIDSLTRVAYVEAADGSSAYEAWVWRSSK